MNHLIRNLPSYSFAEPQWNFLENINLADPKFYVSRPVDLLLGAEVYSKILMNGICKIDDNLPIAQQTRLGWILSGNYRSYQCNIVLHNMDEIQRFWQIEDITETSSLSVSDQNVIKFYEETTKRRSDGRYEVRLPMKNNFEEKLGSTKQKAFAQFHQLERKLNNNKNISEQYKLFMNEYKQLGHMTPADNNMKPDYHMPHHHVTREDSITSKLRVVFNASTPGLPSNLSLNDLMERGPNLQQDLQTLILKWRQYKYAFTADIEKMFRQI